MFKAGTKIKIIDAGNGAYGANGKTGVVTNKVGSRGLFKTETGFNVEVGDGSVWRVSSNGEYEVLEKAKNETKVYIHEIIPSNFEAIVTDGEGKFIEKQVIKSKGYKYKVIYNGTTTIVILEDGSKGIAKCNQTDKYSLQVGHDIAKVRANIEKLKKELKELEDGKPYEERRVEIFNHKTGYKKF